MSNYYALSRFTIPANALNEILNKGRYQKDKAIGFYGNNARDVLFRLEGLCRIYREILDKKFFDKWYKEFKVLEDALGSMDASEAHLKEFGTYKELKKSAEKIYKKNFDEEAKYVTEILKNDGWLSGQRMKEFTDGLNEVDWKDADQDRAAYATVVCEEMDKLVGKYRNGEIDIYNVEYGLHEFRRRLRWVSIYTQIANGLFQLRIVRNVFADINKYATTQIVSSPFNMLPKPMKGQEPIVLQSHYFYALSWLIQYLGDLKDIGLRNQAFLDLTKSAGVKDLALTKQFLATCEVAPQDIYALSENAIDEFIYRDFIPERICRDVMRSVS